MKTVCLVSCGSQKLDRPAPAGEIYTSTLFRLSKRYAQTFDQWFVLSAEHGLLDPSTVIEPYEHQLSREEASSWGDMVVDQLRERVGDALVYVLAGEKYVAPLAERIEVMCPLDGLEIGERLRWLKRRCP